METERKTKNRTFCFKPDALEFIDAFSATYGLSKSAVANYAIFNLKTLLEGAAKDDPRNGARVGMAVAIQAQANDS